MVVYIEKGEPGQRYDWYVTVGVGNQVISRHRKKSAAKDSALTEARKRNAVVKEQMRDGRWKTIRNY